MESETTQEKPPERERKMSFSEERKLSFERERKISADYSAEPRLRTKSFTKYGQTRVVREFVGDKMDLQLEKLKLVKKNMPMDPSSIFRAVCEQKSSVQTDHKELRALVEDMLTPIAQRYYASAEPNHSSKYDRERSIFEILSNITGSRIKVYRNALDEPEVFESEGNEEGREIQVCETRSRGCFDSVYSEEMHEALAMSQSIVYGLLYEGVFGVEKREVRDMIQFIRKDIDEHATTILNEYGMANMQMMEDHHMHAINPLCAGRPPKFPYCACKSLAPEIYRNVEYALAKKKVDETAQAAQNSLAVKFGYGARCLARDGGTTRVAKVVKVSKHDARIVQFEDLPHSTREFNVTDLRPLTSQPVTHHSMQTLMGGTGGRGGGGGQQQMAFLPGCMPPSSMAMPFPGQFGPPFVPPSYGMPPPPYGMPNMPPPAHHLQLPPLMGGPPFSPPMFSPPMMNNGNGQQNQHFFPSTEMLPRPPPPTPMEQEPRERGERERHQSHSSPAVVVAVADSSPALNTSSVFPATPLSSRKSEGGRTKKPRALSAELTDSPTTGRKWEPTWNKQTQLLHKHHKQESEGDKEQGKKMGGGGGGRRATEGDAVGEMNRPLQPKQHRLSTCDSVPENETAGLPSLMATPTQQMQQLQLKNGAATTGAAAARAKLPSLLPLPTALQHSSYYESSEFMGSDTVFKEADISTSQTSLVNTQLQLEVPPPPPTSFSFVPQEVTGVPFITQQQFDEGVNKNAGFSADEAGHDLPDTLTNRFFYNLGVSHFKYMNSIQPPPPDAVPMPPVFTVASPLPMPPGSPAFFSSANPPFSMFQTSAAPPNTPWLAGGPPTTLPPHLMQYVHPGVEGMPFYNGGFLVDDGRGGGGGQMMDGGQLNPMPSPSPLLPNGAEQNYFFPN